MPHAGIPEVAIVAKTKKLITLPTLIAIYHQEKNCDRFCSTFSSSFEICCAANVIKTAFSPVPGAINTKTPIAYNGKLNTRGHADKATKYSPAQ